ncbi:MAG TPA: fibronectin type III domain-containing protein [Steroidobacteraceae bacterium]
MTENTDGSALTDLEGYSVSYGAAADAMDAVIVLVDPSQTHFVVTNLPSGTWYFGVAAHTLGGIDGVPSNIASKTID